MDDLTGMFDEGTDLDARLEAASHILKQAADEEGVDLNSLSEEDLSGMLANIVESDEGEGGGMENGKTAGDVTVADVSLELTKRAAAEGVDLSALDTETYEELFDKVASEMTDPYYFEEAQKWAQQAANMDELGRIAARGFADEIDKLAGDDDHRRRDDDDEDEVDVKVKKAARMLKLAATPMRAGGYLGVREGLSDAAHSAGKYVKGKVHRGLERVGNYAIDRAAGEKGFHQSSSLARRRSLGGKLVAGGSAGTAAVGGGGYYGGKKLMESRDGGGRRKKASLDELAYAVDVFRAHGYDL